MSGCIFCKIVRSEVPCDKVFEDDNFLAFLDIQPFTVGHTIVIPKKHFRWVYDIPNFGEYWEFAKQTTKIIQKSLQPEFISYLTMGNEVPHAHIHLIPRYPNDILSSLNTETIRSKPSRKDFQNILNKIRSNS